MDIKESKNKLEKEKALLLSELGSIGRKSDSDKGDWEAVPTDLNIPEADKNEVADKIEDFEEKFSTEGELEIRLKDVEDALKKISSGAYGICEIGKEQIEDARLSANPSARTCIRHMA